MSQGNGGGGGAGSWSHNDSMIAFGLAGFAGISIVFWLAGQIGAVLTGHAWPPSQFADVVFTALRLLVHPFQPALAWPEAAQSSIPAAPLYYLILGLLLAGGGFAGYWGYNFYKDRSGRGGLGNEASAWSSRKSVATLIVPGPTKGRMIMGRAHGKLVAGEPRQSVIVLGPTQSGKTTGLAIPAILEWEGPVIATSVKSDLARDTLEWRKKLGSVQVYDPTNSTPLPKSTWSPLDGARDWGGAKKIASWLVEAGQGEKSGLNDAQFWYTAAGKLLAPHLFAAAANGYTMADVVRWIDTQEDFELRALLQATGVEDAIQAAEASWAREERARSSIYTTAEVVIEAYSDPTVLESSETCDIRPEDFFDGGMHTLYVCAPGHEQNRLRPVFSTMLNQFIKAAYEKSQSQGGKPLDPPLLIVLDEAANIAPLKDLAGYVSTAAGHGIQLMTVWQDMAQINNRYGEQSQTVVNNHRAKVILSGISDTNTLDYVSRLIGSEEVKQTSYTTDADGRKQKTESKGDKNLAPSDVVRRIKQNEGILVYGALLPARLMLRPWYKNRVLTARADGTATAESAFPNMAHYAEVAAASKKRNEDEESANGTRNGNLLSNTPPPMLRSPFSPPTDPPAVGAPPRQSSPYDDLFGPAPTNAPAYPPTGELPASPGGYSTGGYDPASYPDPYAPPANASPRPYTPPTKEELDDLFDFSDFGDWDSDETDNGKTPEANSFNPPNEESFSGQVSRPTAPKNDEEPPTSTPPTSDSNYPATMQEWLDSFPSATKEAEKPRVDVDVEEERPVGRYSRRADENGSASTEQASGRREPAQEDAAAPLYGNVTPKRRKPKSDQ